MVGSAVYIAILLYIFILQKAVALCVCAETTVGRCIILLHTCDINVVLNAMVKVNQAAILVASPGQPRHQPSKTFLLQSMNTRVNNWKIKNRNENKTTYKSLFFTPREFSSCSSLACVKSVKAFPISKLSKGEGRPISTAVLLFCFLSQQTSIPRLVLYSTMVSPLCARSSELVLVLNLVRQCASNVHHSSYNSWMNLSLSPPTYIDLHSAAHYINRQSLHWHRPLYKFNPLPFQPNNYPDLIPTGTVLTDHHTGRLLRIPNICWLIFSAQIRRTHTDDSKQGE